MVMVREDLGELGSKTKLEGAPMAENRKTFVF